MTDTGDAFRDSGCEYIGGDSLWSSFGLFETDSSTELSGDTEIFSAFLLFSSFFSSS